MFECLDTDHVKQKVQNRYYLCIVELQTQNNVMISFCEYHTIKYIKDPYGLLSLKLLMAYVSVPHSYM